MSLSRRLLPAAIAIFAGLAVAVIIGEIIIRALGIGYGHSPHISDPVLHHRHPPNYIFTAQHPSGEYGGHKVYYDEKGLVALPRLIDEPILQTADRRIAFMGDSFVEATQVVYLDSFVGRLHYSCRTGSTVKNYGTSTYSPLLYLLQWKNDVAIFKPTHVFLLLTAGDMREDKTYSRKAVYSEEKKILAIPGPGNNAWKIRLRKSYFIRFIRKCYLRIRWILKNRNKEKQQIAGNYVEEDTDISELSAGYILNLADRIEKSGAKFTLMAVPSKYRLESGKYSTGNLEFSDKWRMWAREHSIDFLDIVPAFRSSYEKGVKLYFEHDIHFNNKGHEVVAGVIKDRYPEYFR